MSIKRFLISLFPRFGWFVLPWLLVLLIPPVRNIAQLHFEGSRLVYGISLRESIFGAWRYRDDAELNRLEEELGDTAEGRVLAMQVKSLVSHIWSPGGQPAWEEYHKVRLAYPHERWLAPAQLWTAIEDVTIYGQTYESWSREELDARLLLARQVGEQDFDNAFPLVAAAYLRYRAGEVHIPSRPKKTGPRARQAFQHTLEEKEDQVESIIMQAALKPRYEEPYLIKSEKIIAAARRLGWLAPEERAALLELRVNYHPGNGVGAWGMNRARKLWERGERVRALRLAVAIARLGELMSRGRNSLQTSIQGRAWTSGALQVGTGEPGPAVVVPGMSRAGKPVVTSRKPKSSAAAFLRACRREGVPHLGEAMVAMQARREALGARMDSGRVEKDFFEVRNNLGSPVVGRHASELVLWHGALMVGAWLVASCFFPLQRPKPATRRDKLTLAAICVLWTLVGSVGTWYLSTGIPQRPGVASNFYREIMVVYNCVILMVWPVILSWFGVCWLAWRRHPETFHLTGQLRLQMGLSHGQYRLLRSGITYASVLIWLSWLLALTAFWGLNHFQVSTAAWQTFFIPGALNPGLREMLDPLYPGPLIFTTLLAGGAFLLWVFKWFKATAKHAIPVTHSALRWWKESLGVYVILLAWLYLGLGLAYVPAQAAMDKKLDEVQQKGPVQALYGISPQVPDVQFTARSRTP